MKSFKKGIALIAVLAFLITAILPISVLAAEGNSPEQPDAARMVEPRAVTLNPPVATNGTNVGGTATVAAKTYYLGSTAVTPETGILHAEWQAGANQTLQATYWAWSAETTAWTPGVNQPATTAVSTWLGSATQLTSAQVQQCVQTVSTPEQLPGSQKWDLTLQPAITSTWTAAASTGSKYQVAFIAQYTDATGETKYDFLGFNVTAKEIPAPLSSGAPASWTTADWKKTNNAAQYPYVKGAQLPELPAFFIPQNDWPTDAAEASALWAKFGEPTISWMYSDAPITAASWTAVQGSGGLITDGWTTTAGPVKSPDGTKDCPSKSTLAIPETEAAKIQATLDTGKPVYIGAQALWGGGALNWDNSQNFASYRLAPIAAESPLASTQVDGQLTAAISGLDATVTANLPVQIYGASDKYVLTNLKVTQVNNGTPAAAGLTQSNLPSTNPGAVVGTPPNTEKVTGTKLTFKKPGLYHIIADMTFSLPAIKANTNWQRTITGAQFDVELTDGGLKLTASAASGEFTGNPGAWVAENATAEKPLTVPITNTDTITLTAPDIEGTPVDAVSAPMTGIPACTWTVNSATATGTTAISYTSGSPGTWTIPTLDVEPGTQPFDQPGDYVVTLNMTTGTAGTGADEKANIWIGLPNDTTNLTAAQETADQTFTWNIKITAAGQINLENGSSDASTFEQTAPGEWQAKQAITLDYTPETPGTVSPSPLTITGPTFSGAVANYNNAPTCSWAIAPVGDTLGTGTIQSSPTVATTGTISGAPSVQITNPLTYFVKGGPGGEFNLGGTYTVTLTVTPGTDNSWGRLMGTAIDAADEEAATAAQKFTWTLSIPKNGSLTLTQPGTSTPSGTFTGAAPNWTSNAAPANLTIVQGNKSSELTLTGPAVSGNANSLGNPIATWKVNGKQVQSGPLTTSATTPSTPEFKLTGDLLSADTAGTTVPVTLEIDPTSSTWSTILGSTPASGQAGATQIFTWNVAVQANTAGELQLSGSSFSAAGDNAWEVEQPVSHALNDTDPVRLTAPAISGTPNPNAPTTEWAVNGTPVQASTTGITQAGHYTYNAATSAWTNEAPQLAINPKTLAGLKTDGTKNTVTLRVTPGSGNQITKVNSSTPASPTSAQTFTWTVVITPTGQLALSQAEGVDNTDTTTGTPSGTAPNFTIEPIISLAPTQELSIVGPAISGQPSSLVKDDAPAFAWVINGTPLPAVADLPASFSSVVTESNPVLSGSTWNPSVPYLDISNVGYFNTLCENAGLKSLMLDTEGLSNEVQLVVSPGTNTWNNVLGQEAEGVQTFTWTVLISQPGQLALSETGSTTGKLESGEAAGEWQAAEPIVIEEGTTAAETIYGPAISGLPGNILPTFTWTVNGTRVTAAETSASTPAMTFNKEWANNGQTSLTIHDPSQTFKVGEDNVVTLTIDPGVNRWSQLFGEKAADADAKTPQVFTWTVNYAGSVTPPAGDTVSAALTGDNLVRAYGTTQEALSSASIMYYPAVTGKADTNPTAVVRIGETEYALTYTAGTADAEGNVVWITTGTDGPVDLNISDQITLVITAENGTFTAVTGPGAQTPAAGSQQAVYDYTPQIVAMGGTEITPGSGSGTVTGTPD